MDEWTDSIQRSFICSVVGNKLEMQLWALNWATLGHSFLVPITMKNNLFWLHLISQLCSTLFWHISLAFFSFFSKIHWYIIWKPIHARSFPCRKRLTYVVMHTSIFHHLCILGLYSQTQPLATGIWGERGIDMLNMWCTCGFPTLKWESCRKLPCEQPSILFMPSFHLQETTLGKSQRYTFLNH